MTRQTTRASVQGVSTDATTAAQTVSQALFALKRLESELTAALPLPLPPAISGVEQLKALHCAKMGTTRL